ncbi:WD domain-containing protein [Thelonectria olida]|uniref:WD domain-containing protein n=1 Tax=Thelonectria olida TaxID=1576542 RepID=A0A9P8VZC9_9HYPO|nr:WD domain-containing protein [Thelonectria olida]
MDPLSIILATISLLEATSTAYEAIKHVTGLPKAFEKVNESLPLAQDTLRSARDTLTSTEKATIGPIVGKCEEKAKALLDIFEKVEAKHKEHKEHQASEDTKNWPVVDFYRKTLRNLGRMAKAHRVEALMQDIMEELKELAINKIFKTATDAQVTRLEKAIEELAKVEPSVPDSDLEDLGMVNISQLVASGGKGNQGVATGSANQNNVFGSEFNSGGGAMSFGMGFLSNQ